jgi:hypothetical protein
VQLHQQCHRLASSQAGRSRCRRYRSRGLTNILVVSGFQENRKRRRDDRFGVGVLVQGDAALRNVCMAIWGKAKCVVRKTGRQNLSSAMQVVGSRSDSQRGHWRQNLCSAMQGQPKCLLRNARAGTTSPRRCRFIRRKHASTQRTQAFTGRRHPHPPGGVAYATKSADRQPAVAGNTDAVPRESSIVRRPTTNDRRAAGVSPPWMWLGECNPRCAGNPLASALHQPRLAYASRSWLYGVCSVRNAQFAMHSRTWNKSGGRQPAVVR